MTFRRCLRLASAAATFLAALGLAPAARAIDDPYNEIGFFAGVSFPDKDMVGEDKDTHPGPVLGARWRHSLADRVSFSLWADYVPDYDGELAFGDWNEAQVGATLDWYFWRKERVAWYVSPGLGYERLTPDEGDAVNRGLGTLGIGQKIYPGDPGANLFWELRLDPAVGSSGLDGAGVLALKLFGGASWGVGGPPPDADADGVPDRNDSCPNTPGGAKVDTVGCPIDTDADGVFDGIDQCPDTKRGYPVDDKGCPTDADGDGVPDGADTCPDTPKGAKVNETGCPLDTDKDKVFDGIDTCPDTPAGAVVDAKGCPIDSDGDGIFDGLDKCPDTPKGKPVDPAGCPLPEKAAPLFTPEKKSLVLQGINFENDSANLTPDSDATLTTVAASLKDWPEVRVEIGGHTDSKGSNAYNQKLSEARAQSVYAALLAKGVPSAQMTVKGYGESTPIATNDSEAGRAQNRRVELKKLD